MFTTLIVFYVSLTLIAAMTVLKRLEQLGNASVMARFNATTEPVIRKFIGETKNTFKVHLNIRRAGFLTIAVLRTIEKLLLSAQIKIRRFSEILTRKVRYHNLNKPRGTASFFLKDITDYKNHLPHKDF